MAKRIGTLLLAILLAVAIAGGTTALADSRPRVFDLIQDITSCAVPESGEQLVQRNLYRETVNNVEITVLEAGYDGRSLFLCYSFRMLDVDEPLGATAADIYGDDLPEGMDPDMYIDGYVGGDGEELLYNHNVGWWIDDIWFNGKPMSDMPEGSGQYVTGTEVPGELIETDIWRLDQVGVFLEGKVKISLPVGERQDLADYYSGGHPEKYDEDGQLKLPEAGMVTFEYDAGDILSTIRVVQQETETVLPAVTVKVREAAFTPLMTYVTLDLDVNPDALAAFIAENGEGPQDDDGEIMWEYGGMDVFGDWLEDLGLADGDGNLLFPGYYGPDIYGDNDAYFLCPAMTELPETLYLAPPEDENKADLTQGIQILPETVPAQ